MLVPHEEGFQAWRVKNGQAPQRVEGGRGAAWIALPARSVISVPMRFTGVDAARRESAVQLELEAAGLGTETADIHNFEVRNLGADERDQRTMACIQVAPLPAAVLEEGDDAHYAPSAIFHQLTPGEALIWREGGSFVLSVPHPSGAPMYFQALASRELDADAAAELRCVFASLDLAGMEPDVRSIAVVTEPRDGVDLEDLVPQVFADAMDVPVTTRLEQPPMMPHEAARLIPAPVVKLRHQRQQRQMMLLGALAFAFVLLAALGAFAARVWLDERAALAERQRLDGLQSELATIRDAQAAWDDMKWAVAPKLYPVETFHQFVSLLPPKGIRLTRFEVREDAIVIDGEASTLSDGISFKDVLLTAPAFKGWVWDYPPPTSLATGLATFHTEARPAGADEAKEGSSS